MKWINEHCKDCESLGSILARVLCKAAVLSLLTTAVTLPPLIMALGIRLLILGG